MYIRKLCRKQPRIERKVPMETTVGNKTNGKTNPERQTTHNVKKDIQMEVKTD